jgi:hypothetical protein
MSIDVMDASNDAAGPRPIHTHLMRCNAEHGGPRVTGAMRSIGSTIWTLDVIAAKRPEKVFGPSVLLPAFNHTVSD